MSLSSLAFQFRRNNNSRLSSTANHQQLASHDAQQSQAQPQHVTSAAASMQDVRHLSNRIQERLESSRNNYKDIYSLSSVPVESSSSTHNTPRLPLNNLTDKFTPSAASPLRDDITRAKRKAEELWRSINQSTSNLVHRAGEDSVLSPRKNFDSGDNMSKHTAEAFMTTPRDKDLNQSPLLLSDIKNITNEGQDRVRFDDAMNLLARIRHDADDFPSHNYSGGHQIDDPTNSKTDDGESRVTALRVEKAEAEARKEHALRLRIESELRNLQEAHQQSTAEMRVEVQGLLSAINDTEEINVLDLEKRSERSTLGSVSPGQSSNNHSVSSTLGRATAELKRLREEREQWRERYQSLEATLNDRIAETEKAVRKSMTLRMEADQREHDDHVRQLECHVTSLMEAADVEQKTREALQQKLAIVEERLFKLVESQGQNANVAEQRAAVAEAEVEQLRRKVLQSELKIQDLTAQTEAVPGHQSSTTTSLFNPNGQQKMLHQSVLSVSTNPPLSTNPRLSTNTRSLITKRSDVVTASSFQRSSDDRCISDESKCLTSSSTASPFREQSLKNSHPSPNTRTNAATLIPKTQQVEPLPDRLHGSDHQIVDKRVEAQVLQSGLGPGNSSAISSQDHLHNGINRLMSSSPPKTVTSESKYHSPPAPSKLQISASLHHDSKEKSKSMLSPRSIIYTHHDECADRSADNPALIFSSHTAEGTQKHDVKRSTNFTPAANEETLSNVAQPNLPPLSIPPKPNSLKVNNYNVTMNSAHHQHQMQYAGNADVVEPLLYSVDSYMTPQQRPVNPAQSKPLQQINEDETNFRTAVAQQRAARQAAIAGAQSRLQQNSTDVFHAERGTSRSPRGSSIGVGSSSLNIKEY